MAILRAETFFSQAGASNESNKILLQSQAVKPLEISIPIWLVQNQMFGNLFSLFMDEDGSVLVNKMFFSKKKSFRR
jgi:hypothetical protein